MAAHRRRRARVERRRALLHGRHLGHGGGPGPVARRRRLPAVHPAPRSPASSLLRGRASGLPPTLWADGFTAALGVMALCTAIVAPAVLDALPTEPLAVATNLAYPIGDLLLLGVIVGVLASTGWQADRRWLLLVAGRRVLLGGGLRLPRPGRARHLRVPEPVGRRLVARAAADRGGGLAARVRAPRAHRPRPADRRPARLQHDRPRAADLRLRRRPRGAGHRARGRVAAGDHVAAHPDLPREHRDGPRLARGGAHRRAHRPREPPRARARARAAAAAGLRGAPARADDLRPRRLQALQRHVRPPGRGCAAQAPRQPPRGAPARPRLRVPHGRRRVLRAARARRRRRPRARRRRGRARRCPSTARASRSPARRARSRSRARPATPSEALRIADQRMYANKHAGRSSASRQSTDVLLRALAERHPDLGQHLAGVAELAEATARRLGLATDEIAEVHLAAELHDVGKVAVPDSILSKPGPLDEPEWDFIRRHTLVGERIIAAAPALGRVARLVRSSHERWDGNGYPDRLAGDAIPLGARIVAVADAFDAMTAGAAVPRAARAGGGARGAARLRRHAVRPRRGRGLHGRLAGRRRARRRVDGPRGGRPARCYRRAGMAASADTLRRTPLHGRHAAAGARLVPFAGWEMPVQYSGIREEHLAVRTAVGVFDVSHMGQVETTGPGAEAFLQRMLSNDVAKLTDGGAQYSVLTRDDGGVLDDLFTYRLGARALPHGHERLQPRARPRLAAPPRRRARRRGPRPPRRLRDARRPGARGPRARRRAHRRRAAEALPHRRAHRRRRGRRARVRHGLHGRGRRRAAARARPRRRGVGRARRGRGASRRARRARHAAPRGLLPPLRQRPHGGPRPDRGRPRLVLQGGHGLHRVRRRRAPCARRAPPSASSPSP